MTATPRLRVTLPGILGQRHLNEPGARLAVALLIVCCGCQSSTAPVAFSREQFRQQVLEQPQLVIVGFSSAGAGDLEAMQRIVNALPRGAEGQSLLKLVDVDQSAWARDEWQIRTTPVLVAFENGREIDRLVGRMEREDIAIWLRELERRKLQVAVDAVKVPELHLTEADFEAQLAAETTPVLVDFWAPWCGPCQMIAPHLRLLAGEYAGRLRVAKVNVDEQGALSGRFVKGGIPLLVLFHDGQEVDRVTGAPPPDALREWVESHLQRLGATARPSP